MFKHFLRLGQIIGQEVEQAERVEHLGALGLEIGGFLGVLDRILRPVEILAQEICQVVQRVGIGRVFGDERLHRGGGTFVIAGEIEPARVFACRERSEPGVRSRLRDLLDGV